MANTLSSLFPHTCNNWKDFNIFPCYAEFSAPLIAGKYVFNERTTPPVEFEKLLQGQVGYIAGVMISANCTPDQFAAAVDKPLLLRVLHGGNNTPVNQNPFPFTEFSQGDNFTLPWEITAATVQQEEAFKLAVNGELDQLTGMTLNELVLKITFNFIRVGSKNLKG